MRYRLTVDVDSEERLTTWDIACNLPHLLALALSDINASELTGFTLYRLDGPPIFAAIEACEEVDMRGTLPS